MHSSPSLSPNPQGNTSGSVAQANDSQAQQIVPNEPVQSSEVSHKTGWPAPELAQDDDRKLFRWFAGKADARVRVREACAEITEQQREAAILKAISRMNTHIEGMAECDRKSEETGAPIYAIFAKAHATRIEVLGSQILQLMAGRPQEQE